MANRKVGIIEKLKREDGTWTNVPVHFSKSRTSGKGRRGKFLLVWREGGQRIYHPLPNYKDGSLPLLGDAIIAKEQKEQYLASLAAGLKVEDPVESKTRLTVGAGIDEFLGNLMGHGNTVALYTYSLHQFRDWNTKHKNKKTFLDQIDRPHMLAFKKWCQEQGGKDGKPNGELTAVWKCMRMNKCIKTMLNLPAGKGPVTKGDFSEVLNRRPVVVTYTKEERDSFLARCKGTRAEEAPLPPALLNAVRKLKGKLSLSITHKEPTPSSYMQQIAWDIWDAKLMSALAFCAVVLLPKGPVSLTVVVHNEVRGVQLWTKDGQDALCIQRFDFGSPLSAAAGSR